MNSDKSCNLKGQQKLFYLQNSQASSCCRSHKVKLDSDKNIDHYIDLWQQEKNQLKQGIEIISCENCWIDERRGIKSFRQKEKKGPDIELYFDNLCNHMCSYCSAKLSSVWEESINTHGVFDNISKTAKANQIVPQYRSASVDHWLVQIQNYIAQQDDNSVTIKICGGEPLMQVRNIQKFLELDSKKIKRLMFNTNLNPPNNRFLIWILENFPKEKLHFDVSIDATTAYNAIPRAGFDQDRFVTNLALLKQHQVEFAFLSVISVLSIFDIGNFYSWTTSNQYQTTFDKINNPDCLDPLHLSTEFKQKILNSSSHLPESVVEILCDTQEPVDLKLFEQYNYLNQYFSRSNIDPNNTGNQLFGEYWNWLSNKKFY